MRGKMGEMKMQGMTWKTSKSWTGLAVMVATLGFNLGSVAQATEMTAVLRLQEKVPMESLAAVIHEGRSPMLRGYTAEEIRQIAAPEPVEYDALIASLRQEGFTITGESTTRLWVSVKADHSLFEKVFSTKLETNLQNERRAMVEPSVPAHLGLVAAVNGLSSFKRRNPLMRKSMGLTATPQGGLSRDEIVQAYHLDSLYAAGYNGSGQDVAVATYGDVKTEVIQSFYQQLELSPAPSVDKVTFNGPAALDDDAATETSLDAEFIGMIAPGAHVHVFTSAANSDAGEMQLFTAILDDGRAKVVNYSWGGCEPQLTAQHAAEMGKVFARAVAQGVNILVASGDNGSDSCNNGKTAADWPAAHPAVVAVGGTSLNATAGGFNETAWSGSGGGISKKWAAPAWQKGTTRQTKRVYPDVSFNADGKVSPQPIYISYKGQVGWAPVGGTSMATPQWAGFLALVNAARAQNGKAALGFLNPLIYGLDSGTRASAFNDVTEGSNGAYKAGVGFDAVTGWGSMNGAALAPVLVGL